VSLQPLKFLFPWLLPLLVSANFVNWLGNYNLAHQKALKEHKSLLVLVVKKNDPLSSQIIKNSFMNKKYVDVINHNMVSVIVTYEGALTYPVEMYYTTVFPTLFFVDSSRETFLREPLYGENISDKVLEKYVKDILLF